MFSPYPQGFFPQLCVTTVCVQGTEMGGDNAVGERFIDNARIDGNIVNMLNESISFVRRNMKTATCIDPQTGRRSDKPEYPVVAVRELILNALEVIDVTENRYSGIPTVYSAMKNAGLPEPKFENERGIFRATLYNSAEIPAPVTGNEEDLLIFCRTPRTRAEIEQHFKGRLSINYLMAHIIRPLVGQGKIKLAIPDKPRSKNQKYYS